MKKSKGLMLILIMLIFFYTLIRFSNATSQIQISKSKIERPVQVVFTPYRQTTTSASMQALIQPKMEESTYSVRYNPSSMSKNLELNNALLKVKVYYNGNPKGIMLIATDDQQRFLFSEFNDRSSLIFEVVSIIGQEQSNTKCVGGSSPGYPDIIINCK